MTKSDRIGIVGTGRMGANIAQHLKDEGYDVVRAVRRAARSGTGNREVYVGAQTCTDCAR